MRRRASTSSSAILRWRWRTLRLQAPARVVQRARAREACSVAEPPQRRCRRSERPRDLGPCLAQRAVPVRIRQEVQALPRQDGLSRRTLGNSRANKQAAIEALGARASGRSAPPIDRRVPSCSPAGKSRQRLRLGGLTRSAGGASSSASLRLCRRNGMESGRSTPAAKRCGQPIRVHPARDARRPISARRFSSRLQRGFACGAVATGDPVGKRQAARSKRRTPGG